MNSDNDKHIVNIELGAELSRAELSKEYYVRIRGTNKYYCGLIYLDRSEMEYSFQNDDADICMPLPVTREKADELIRENPSLEMISAYELIYPPS